MIFNSIRLYTFTEYSMIYVNVFLKMSLDLIKGNYRENIPSNKTETSTKSMNMYIWAISTLNRVFIRACHAQIKFSKI